MSRSSRAATSNPVCSNNFVMSLQAPPRKQLNHNRMKRSILLATFFLAFASGSFADAIRGTLVHEATLRVAPSVDAAKLSQVDRGHELVIIETSREWTHVQAIMMEPPRERDEDEENEPKTVTGW